MEKIVQIVLVYESGAVTFVSLPLDAAIKSMQSIVEAIKTKVDYLSYDMQASSYFFHTKGLVAGYLREAIGPMEKTAQATERIAKSFEIGEDWKKDVD